MGKSTGAAKCSVCGHAHWMADPHIWDDEPKKKLAIKEVLTVANSMANATVAGKAPSPISKKALGVVPPTYKYRDAEKRRTYQRDLMRKRRSEKRGDNANT